jgi:hypothetical protein
MFLQHRSGDRVASEQSKIEALQEMVIQLTGALISVRSAVDTIARQPSYMRKDDRDNIKNELASSLDRIDKVLKSFDRLAESEAPADG